MSKTIQDLRDKRITNDHPIFAEPLHLDVHVIAWDETSKSVVGNGAPLFFAEHRRLPCHVHHVESIASVESIFVNLFTSK